MIVEIFIISMSRTQCPNSSSAKDLKKLHSSIKFKRCNPIVRYKILVITCMFCDKAYIFDSTTIGRVPD